jgi:hypothetical protein
VEVENLRESEITIRHQDLVWCTRLREMTMSKTPHLPNLDMTQSPAVHRAFKGDFVPRSCILKPPIISTSTQFAQNSDVPSSLFPLVIALIDKRCANKTSKANRHNILVTLGKDHLTTTAVLCISWTDIYRSMFISRNYEETLCLRSCHADAHPDLPRNLNNRSLRSTGGF